MIPNEIKHIQVQVQLSISLYLQGITFLQIPAISNEPTNQKTAESTQCTFWVQLLWCCHCHPWIGKNTLWISSWIQHRPVAKHRLCRLPMSGYTICLSVGDYRCSFDLQCLSKYFSKLRYQLFPFSNEPTNRNNAESTHCAFWAQQLSHCRCCRWIQMKTLWISRGSHHWWTVPHWWGYLPGSGSI